MTKATAAPFKPTKILVVTAMNDDLYLSRKVLKYKNFSNLHTLGYDRQKISHGLKGLDMPDVDTSIRHFRNLNFEEFAKVIVGLQSELLANNDNGERTLVYF